MLKVGDKVIMLEADSWADKGWTGRIRDISRTGLNILWDNGRLFWHRRHRISLLQGKNNPSYLTKDLGVISDLDPNRAFILHKSKKKEKKTNNSEQEPLLTPTMF